MIRKILTCFFLTVWVVPMTLAAQTEPEEPTCSEEQLTEYQTCVDVCGTDVEIGLPECVAQGTVDGFVAYLQAALADCTFPGLENPKQWNGLKKVLGGLKQSGILTREESRELRRSVNGCRKAQKKENKGDDDDDDEESEEAGSSNGGPGKGKGPKK